MIAEIEMILYMFMEAISSFGFITKKYVAFYKIAYLF